MKNCILFLVLWFPLVGKAQEDLMKMAMDSSTIRVPVSTFKGIRVINGHSVETVRENNLDFIIQHRFGPLSQGIKEFFGLDVAVIRLGLEYGLTDRLMIGLGRSSYEKNVDIFTKYRLLTQNAGPGGVPVSLSAFVSYAVRTQKPFNANTTAAERSSYTGQLLLARKFSDALSIQLSPGVVYRTLPDMATDKQLVFATGLGSRFKLTKRTSLNAEWFYVLPNQLNTIYTNSLSLGFDIETGGHVFQLGFSNAYGMAERQFITETTGAWNKGDLHFGFNISRTFSFGRKLRNYENY